MNSYTYRSMIGNLIYLTCIRSDITFVVRVASKFMENPIYSYMKALKKIIKYIKKIEDLELHYVKANKLELVDYINSN
jgi:hypothetical protein